MNKFYKSLLLSSMVFAGANTFAQNPEPKIAEFTSVEPTGQTELMIIPPTHTFQVLGKSGVTTYTSGEGTLGQNNDFTGYIPVAGSSKQGYLSINHETTPGGVSLLNLDFNESNMLWEVGEVRKVDFGPVQSTIRNCSGGVTPWGTVITSEENTTGGDADGDGFEDIGWQVEIDPVSGEIVDYDGDGNPDKLWSHGRINHENIVVREDGLVTYEAEDGGSSCVFKFVANTAGDLSEGALYVLGQSEEDPTVGTWHLVADDVEEDKETLNNLRSLARSMGGTSWRNPEDVEIGPDGMIYFTSKGTGTIWRFRDNGNDVSEIEAWVTNKDYQVDFDGGSRMEDWGTGIDNLTFDAEGNLWALQDGGRNNLWVIYPDHTPETPNLKLFMTTPSGSESTGLTFSPDGRYGFISLQHPSSGNTTTLQDAAGDDITFNDDVTLVFARREALGEEAVITNTIKELNSAELIKAFPNPFASNTNLQVNLNEQSQVSLEVFDLMGKKVRTLHTGSLSAGEHIFDFAPAVDEAGTYMVRLVVNDEEAKTIMVKKQ